MVSKKKSVKKQISVTKRKSRKTPLFSKGQEKSPHGSNIEIVRHWALAALAKIGITPEKIQVSESDTKKYEQYKGKMMYYPYPSIKKRDKKFVVYVPSANKKLIKEVYFGDPDYDDFSVHQNLAKRKSYLARATGLPGNGLDIGHANFWSIRALWDGPDVDTLTPTENFHPK